MKPNAHEPAGFCPYCDYAMDPGRCTECGRDVSPKQLATSPKIQRVIRIIRRSVFVLACIGIPGAIAYGIYHETRPHQRVRYYSTDYLLSKQSRPHREPNASELRRRFRLNQLSSGQITRLIEINGLMMNPVLVRDIQPVNDILELRGTTPACMHFPNIGCAGAGPPYPYCMYIKTHDYSIQVDGELKKRVAQTEYPSQELNDVVRDLSPGKYQITIKRHTTFGLHPAAFYAQRTHPIPSVIPNPCSTDASKTITVSEHGPEHHVTPIFDEALFYSKLHELWFDETGRCKCHRPRFYTAPLPGLAGTLHLLPNGFEVGEPETCSFRIPHDEEQIEELLAKCTDGDRKLSAIFIPSAALAYDAGYRTYFNGVIRWDDVELRNGAAHFGAPTGLHRFLGDLPVFD